MRERGLSMIEVVVAMMVFAVGICSAVSVGYVASHWGTRARAEMEASRLARAVFDYARRVDHSSARDLLSQECVPPADPAPDPAFEFQSPVQFVWKVKIEDPDSLGLHAVTITVSRDTDGDGQFDDYVPSIPFSPGSGTPFSPESGDETVAVFHALIR